MKDVTMVRKMLSMQELLERSNKTSVTTIHDYECARIELIDSISVLVHTFNGDWKKAMTNVESKKAILEALVKIWHLSLSLNIHNKIDCYQEALTNEAYKKNEMDYIIICVVSSYADYYSMVALTKKLGFTIKDVYAAYMKQHKDYERIAECY